MKILIFYASYGGGHLSAAKSIKQYIEANYPYNEIQMIDCMKYINKGIDKLTTGFYNMSAKKAPWAWGITYKLSSTGPIFEISNFNNRVMSLKLDQLFKEFNPDLVISTHPFSTQMTANLKKLKKTNCFLASIMTDFEPHNQWLVGYEYIDCIFVSNEKMRQKIIDKGIPDSKIFTTGIPLSNKFLEHFDHETIKKSFDLDLNRKTILFFGGGEFGLAKSQTIDILKAFINNLDDAYQMVVISGKNEKIKHKFESLVKYKKVEKIVKVLGYTNQVPELMSISDLVITKPGGLTVTESLASGLPIIAINPIPGQEVENAEFLEKSEVALWLKKDDNPDDFAKNLLSDVSKIQHMKINSKLIAKRNSTKDICEIIFNCLQ